MFTHVQSIFGRKTRRPGVVDVTAQAKLLGFFPTPQTNEVLHINASAKDPVIIEFLVHVEEGFNSGAAVITIGTNSPNYDDIYAAADIAENVVGFSAVVRKFYTAKTKIFIKYAAGGSITAGKLRVLATAKGCDNRGN